MTKTATATRKAAVPAAVAKKRKTAAQKFRELPLAERKRRIAALCDEVEAFWKGKPDTGALAHLLKMRRGAS
jgi:hypothetical protein